MPGAIAPVVGGVLSLVGANVANKATQKAADNAGTAARAFSQQAYDQASANELQAVNSAKAALSAWFQNNPGPASGWGNARMPAPSGPSRIGGARQMPPNPNLQYAQGGGGGLRAMLQQMVQPQQQGQAPTMPMRPQPPPTPPPAMGPSGGSQPQPQMNPAMLQQLLMRAAMRRMQNGGAPGQQQMQPMAQPRVAA